MNEHAYLLGRRLALTKLGMPIPQDPPGAGGSSLTAEEFSQFSAEDANVRDTGSEEDDSPGERAGTPWSAEAPLESGDAGTRNQPMGLPQYGGV